MDFIFTQVTVLNEGAVIIRRPGRAETSSSESEEEEEVAPQEPEEVKPEEPPPRDPLEVEEEMLNEKLQTAGFFLSMPEEEQIKKRLLEIKQMRENPELFTPENTKVQPQTKLKNYLQTNKVNIYSWLGGTRKMKLSIIDLHAFS